MKTLLGLFFFLLTVVGTAFGQATRKFDVLHLLDQSTLEVKIIEIDASTVKYKKSSDLNGPLFTIQKSEIGSIVYGNGETEVLNQPALIQEYYKPGTQPGTQPGSQQRTASSVEQPIKPAPAPKNEFEAKVIESSTDRLQTFYKYYKKESKKGLRKAIIGISVGTVASAVGTALLIDAEDNTSGYYSNSNVEQAQVGALMMIGGLATGAIFGITGFVKAAKNNNKAGRVKKELTRRNVPLQVRLIPSFNPHLHTGNLALIARF
ncbi:hypothetical protein CLV98_11477 [Dyadobacter jejuensis]|uniref:Uncharacterized protein n=1 Tax=Dyadobacter jejuensis TaxID=1082580 RepID=A0A316ADH6_9BACT|nr:hypothetical protein [Dyadobacter jejuensis]PWJ55308.1 hypothetical protein CLV98_11477 [Dyadobacter jejuensis]